MRGGFPCVRHRVYGKHLGRNKNERTSLFKNLVSSLFTHGTIETSQTKARAIKGMVDKIINLAKNKNSQHMLQNFFATAALKDRLVKDLVSKFEGKNSGYTSLVRLGARRGDQTMMVRMSLIGAEKLEAVKSDKIRSNQKIRESVSQKEKTDTPINSPRGEAGRSTDTPISSEKPRQRKVKK